MRDAGGAQSLAQALWRASPASSVRAALSILRASQRVDERQRLVAPQPPGVDEGKRVPPLRSEQPARRRDLEIERGDRPCPPLRGRPRRAADPLSTPAALTARSRKAASSRAPAKRVAPPHRRAASPPRKTSALVRSRTARCANHAASRAARISAAASSPSRSAPRRHRGFDLQPFRFASLGRQKIAGLPAKRL